MNTQTQEALKMAIEALMVGSKIADTFLPSDDRTIQISKAINACKEALEQPAQEPNCYGDGNVYRGLRSEDSKVKTYHVNTPPHQWQGLTDDVVASIWMHEAVPMNGQDFKRVYRAIEQALKEKNK